MTFLIEAIKEDHQITDFRSSCMVAVILARKLAAEGFTVSITAPSGRHYTPGQSLEGLGVGKRFGPCTVR